MKDEKKVITPEEKSAPLTDEQMSHVSGGNTQISDEDASNKRCSSFAGTLMRDGEMKCCKKCRFYLTNGQCTKDRIPTLEAEVYKLGNMFN